MTIFCSFFSKLDKFIHISLIWLQKLPTYVNEKYKIKDNIVKSCKKFNFFLTFLAKFAWIKLNIIDSRIWGVYSILGCLDGDRSSLISKKSLIWFIVISPAKFQPPNPCITATNCISRYWSFGRFVWKSKKKLPNFFYFRKTLWDKRGFSGLKHRNFSNPWLANLIIGSSQKLESFIVALPRLFSVIWTLSKRAAIWCW